MKLSLYSLEALRLQESLLIDRLTPDYAVGDCYPKACLGHSRWIDHLIEIGSTEANAAQFGVDYCQGWYLRRWQSGHIDGFPHGFLLDTKADRRGDGCIIDPLHHRYPGGYEPFWVPLQRWNWFQVERWMECPTTAKCWPLTTRNDGTELEDRWGYQRAFDQSISNLELITA